MLMCMNIHLINQGAQHLLACHGRWSKIGFTNKGKRALAPVLQIIEDVQDALNHYECIDGTLEHLSRPSDAVIRELLAFLAALLFNGNENVQVRGTFCVF